MLPRRLLHGEVCETHDPERAFVTRHTRAPDLPVGRHDDHIATRAMGVPPAPVGVSGPLDRFDRGGETVDHTT